MFASDVRNAENRGTGDVYVTPVASLSFLASRVEAEIDASDWLLLPLSTSDAEGRPMRHCHRLPIAVGVEDASVIEVDKRELGALKKGLMHRDLISFLRIHRCHL